MTSLCKQFVLFCILRTASFSHHPSDEKLRNIIIKYITIQYQQSHSNSGRKPVNFRLHASVCVNKPDIMLYIRASYINAGIWRLMMVISANK